MTLPLLCDEHIPYPIVEGLKRRGLDVKVVQQVGLSSAKDELILEAAREQQRIVYTMDADFLRLHASGVKHEGIFYHRLLAYSIGEAIRKVVIACERYSLDEMKNRVEFL